MLTCIVTEEDVRVLITKAIVEQVVDQYNVRVRIPIIDRIPQSSVHTTTDQLNIATVCVPQGHNPNFKVGDVVFVSIDETDVDEVVILGYLYRQNIEKQQCDAIINQLDVLYQATLPENTSIGSLTPYEISCLKGVKMNLQEQIDMLKDEIELLNIKLKQTTSNV